MRSTKTSKGNKIARPVVGGKVAKVATDPDGNVLTQAQLRRFADATVDGANVRVKKAGTELDGAANFLFTSCFVMDVEAALSLETHSTAQYDVLSERAGKSLILTADKLSAYVRIGAMNQLIRADAWGNTEFTRKLELLPLTKIVDAEGERDLSSFHKGVKYANQPNVGVTAVREWVQAELPRVEGSVGRPRGMTIAAGATFLKTGVKLATPKHRASIAKSVKAASPAKRKAFTKDLKTTIAALQALLAEVDDSSDD